ncbi:PHP domain-like protein [Dentipellis sp. KUC8613]|nr:PHP domain-like protein [Dentipellis sp. KUC8613]
MYFDLNVPIPAPASGSAAPSTSKKGKGKQAQQQQAAPTPAPAVIFSPAQITAIEARVDMLVHLGYTVIALTQTVQKKVEQKSFVNVLDPLLRQLRPRPGIVFLKRLTIVLDEDSEKGFGLTNANAPLFAPYDLLALLPTTETTFSLACLTHTQPSPLTAHILSVPLTLPRLPFRMKHTLVRAALRSGAVFEVNYAGALGLGAEDGLGDVVGTAGAGAKRNWWAAAREVVRVTKGRGVLLSGGGASEAELRAPKDVGNLATFLDLPQNLAHDASTTTPKSLVLRAQTRRTYRAVFSEPKVVIPPSSTPNVPVAPEPAPSTAAPEPALATDLPSASKESTPNKKRPRDEEAGGAAGSAAANGKQDGSEGSRKKKKKNKAKAS